VLTDTKPGHRISNEVTFVQDTADHSRRPLECLLWVDAVEKLPKPHFCLLMGAPDFPDFAFGRQDIDRGCFRRRLLRRAVEPDDRRFFGVRERVTIFGTSAMSPLGT